MTTAEKKELATPQRIGAVVIGGDFQGLGILRSLARQGVPVYLLDRGLCIGRFSRYVKEFVRLPDAGGSLCLEFLINLAKRQRLEGWLIYANDDETVRFLAKHKEQLEAYYRVTTPAWDVVKFACEKRLTYQLAAQCGVAAPRTVYPHSAEELRGLEIEFPVVIKPSVKEPFYSRTGKKAIRVDDRRGLAEEYTRAERAAGGGQIMVQEFIPGGTEVLFSVGSLSRNGELLARIVAKRPRQHPMDFGHATTYAETVDIPELEEATKKILGAMGYHGLSEAEFMLDRRDGKYKLIEINPRPWGWHTLAIGAGVDLPYLSYRDMLGEEVHQHGFDRQAKWIRLITDTPTAFMELLKGRMKVTDYLRSLKGKKQFAVLSWRDPLPFMVELIMLPYLWKKRGF